LNLSREFDTQAPPIMGRFTDAVGKILTPKTSEMLWAEPIHRDIAIARATTIGRWNKEAFTDNY